MESKRLYIPALGPIYETFDPYVLPLLRIAMGLILIPHGCQKAFGWFGGLGFAKFTVIFDKIGWHPAAFWLTLVMLTEMIGGLCLVLGLFTRLAALAIVIFMINAVWFTSGKGFFWTAGGAEYSILIGFVALVFLVRGARKFSLDERLNREF